MATTLLSPLPTVAFSLNRVIASFQTDAIYSSLGVTAVNEIELNGTVFPFRKIVISYGNVSQSFTAAPVLPPQGNNLKSGPGSWALASDWVAYFQANYYLNRDFIITAPNNAGTPRVVFTAKQIGSAYNFIPVLYTSVYVRNVTAGADKVKKKNHSLEVKCLVKRPDSSDFDVVYVEKIPYRNARVTLNIAKLLHAELTPDFPPAWDTTVPWKHARSTRKYRLQVAEGDGDPLSFQPQETFPDAYVHYGGTGFRGNLNKTATEWIQGASASQDRFLKLGSEVRWLQTDEPHWLTFLNTRGDITSLKVQIRVEYQDNSIVTVTRDVEGGLLSKESITLPVWISALNLHTVDPAKAIRSYYVRLLSGTDAISEELRFVLDYANREHKQYFVYLNSLGGWDSFLAYGESSYNFTLSNQQVYHPIPLNYQTWQGDMSDVGATIRDKFVVSTSFYSLEQLRVRFRDFFVSEYKYRYIDGHCYPISITSKEFSEGSDGQNYYKHDFEYQFAFENPVFD